MGHDYTQALVEKLVQLFAGGSMDVRMAYDEGDGPGSPCLCSHAQHDLPKFARAVQALGAAASPRELCRAPAGWTGEWNFSAPRTSTW